MALYVTHAIINQIMQNIHNSDFYVVNQTVTFDLSLENSHDTSATALIHQHLCCLSTCQRNLQFHELLQN